MPPSILPAFSFCKLARRNARKCPQILQSTSQNFLRKENSLFLKKKSKEDKKYQEDDNEEKDEEENNDDK